MKLFRILAIAALAMVSSASAQAGAITGVVLSNMGENGDTFPTSGSSHNVSSSGLSRLAVAITVGSSNFTLDKINIGAFGTSQSSGATGVTGTLTIYTDSSGDPSTNEQTSASQTLFGDDNYTFDFSSQGGKVLTAGTKYWMVLTSAGVDSAWYFNGSAPTTYPPGGVTYTTTKFRDSTGSAWDFTGRGYFAISGTPNSEVPEPALTSLLCLGGVALIRRRMKK
ncbi:MAG: choice-of-anchor R domain-containing protein [Planctomycetota bacterium]